MTTIHLSTQYGFRNNQNEKRVLSTKSSLEGRAQPVQRASLSRRLAPWIIGAFALSSLAYLILSRQKVDNRNSTEFANIDVIETLTDLGGVPVATLNERGEERRLLQVGDSLKEVLRRDWKTVATLGLTHIKLVNILEKIIGDTSHISSETKDRKYYPTELENSLIGQNLSPQDLRIDYHLKYKCCQTDPFEMPHTWHTPCMCDYLEITNTITHLSTGKFYPEIIDLAKRWGFYTNGSARLDPVRLVSVLTGQDPAALQQRVDAALAAAQRP
jgi:hypothetical protein